MQGGDYLGFLLGGRRHGIPMSRVREIRPLPLLQPTERVPSHVLGFFNLRSVSIPILDLPLLLGLTLCSARDTDRLVLFASEDSGELWGFLADEVEDLIFFASEDLSEPADDPLRVDSIRRVVALGRKGERLYHLLDPEALIRMGDDSPESGRYEKVFQELAPELGAKLLARAQEAAEQQADVSVQGFATYISFTLGGEFFAIDIRQVRQISICPPVHPVPGSPPTILGLANLRGEPLLVADLRPMLSMRSDALLPEARLLVVEDGPGKMGLYADEVGEVLALDPQFIQPHPAKGENAMVAGEYLANDKLYTLLSLSEVLAHPALTTVQP